VRQLQGAYDSWNESIGALLLTLRRDGNCHVCEVSGSRCFTAQTATTAGCLWPSVHRSVQPAESCIDVVLERHDLASHLQRIP
jgi:peptide methionine sulfoxide reductase MsrB